MTWRVGLWPAVRLLQPSWSSALNFLTIDVLHFMSILNTRIVNEILRRCFFISTFQTLILLVYIVECIYYIALINIYCKDTNWCQII